MSQNNFSRNVLALPATWDMVATPYSNTSAVGLAKFAEEALPLAKINSSSRILDVACGPGTLSLLAAPQVNHVTALDFSEEMLAIFRKRVAEQKIPNIDIHHGDGQDLPLSDETFDAAFSMFGLMFFPNRAKGFAEIYRTLKPGGRAVVSSWAPVEKSPFMTAIYGAMRTIVPEAPKESTSVSFMLDDPKIFREEMAQAGFKNVEVKPVTKHFVIRSVETFWQEASSSNVRVLMVKKAMDANTWEKKETLALDYLRKLLPTTPTTLSSDAWIAVGMK